MTRNLAHDRAAAASAEIGVIFVSLALISGSLWGRPVWGIWWTWDLRLTTTFILWLLYLSYLVLRRAVGDRERRAMLSAVVGLLGFLDVPLVYAANRVKASQHPAPVVGGGEKSGLAPEFLATLLLGVFTMTIFYFLLLRVRTELAAIEDDIEALWLERS
jgi:heme exporter protein C